MENHNLNVIKAHLASLSSSSWTELRSTISVDVVYEEVPRRQRSAGSDACVAAGQRWKIAFPDLRATVVRSYTVGEEVICELDWEGTHTGLLDTTVGGVAATNRKARFKAMSVFVVRANKIVEVRHYYDLLTLLSQLGAVPALETTALGRSDTVKIPEPSAAALRRTT